MYTIKRVTDGKSLYLVNRNSVFHKTWVEKKDLERGMLFLRSANAKARLTRLRKESPEEYKGNKFFLVHMSV